MDVCSLYPYVLKTGTFPLGQPTIYIGEQCSELIGAVSNFNFDSVESIIWCTVLSSRDLFHLVFPYRIQDKLLSGLCSCCETFSQAECTHDLPADREFIGAWVFCELRKTFEKDYIVTSVSENGNLESRGSILVRGGVVCLPNISTVF